MGENFSKLRFHAIKRAKFDASVFFNPIPYKSCKLRMEKNVDEEMRGNNRQI
jgi:hypothetical protein